ncbi:MAG TPA: alpha-L-rhamnosidase, partial [Chitinophagaceae bacterium]|nr:alpha-L-rhamnosidase [Chitinophagaceae bacterium]
MLNRYRLLCCTLMLCTLHFCVVAGAVPPELVAERLTTEYAQNPLTVSGPHPRFSWNLTSGQRGARQTAYELVVGRSEAEVRKGQGGEWQSGKTPSGDNLHIAYAGKPLQPFTRYYWSVQVYDAAGQASGWSAPAFFETAALQPSDWKGEWI